MIYQELIDKLTKIEALIAKTSSEGERQAALAAKQRLMQKSQQFPQEYTISHHNIWKKRLFLAICHKYGVSVYRYPRQRTTTSIVQTTPTIMDECIWPEYKKYVTLLEDCVQGIMDDLISKITGDYLEETEAAIPQLENKSQTEMNEE